jgi:hypothetical protein
MYTSFFEALVEPSQPSNHNYDVDETKIADHGNHIDVDLWITFSTVLHQYYALVSIARDQRIERPTCSARTWSRHSPQRRTHRRLGGCHMGR